MRKDNERDWTKEEKVRDRTRKDKQRKYKRTKRDPPCILKRESETDRQTEKE